MKFQAQERPSPPEYMLIWMSHVTQIKEYPYVWILNMCAVTLLNMWLDSFIRASILVEGDCNTLQHTATRCNTLLRPRNRPHTCVPWLVYICDFTCSYEQVFWCRGALLPLKTPTRRCNTLQHTALHCIALHHTASHCNTLQHAATLSCALEIAHTHVCHDSRFVTYVHINIRACTVTHSWDTVTRSIGIPWHILLDYHTFDWIIVTHSVGSLWHILLGYRDTFYWGTLEDRDTFIGPPPPFLLVKSSSREVCSVTHSTSWKKQCNWRILYGVYTTHIDTFWMICE